MQRKAYFALALLMLGSAAAALAVSWTAPGRELDQHAYDFLFRLESPAPWRPKSIILAIDEESLTKYGGLTGIRAALSDGLMKIAPAHPAAVAVDIILPDASATDDSLEQAFAETRNLVLSSDLLADGTWEDPIPRFRKHAVAVGEVHADLDKFDAVSRDIPLEKAGARDRRWALALATSAAVKGSSILESPEDLVVGDTHIPSSDLSGRVMRIRYTPPSMHGIPRVTVAELDRNPAL
ncbi:MAG TPA: CHASE2 domain-containing protein, partial [Bryobacteraceae bacterium]|nr:CHASE2 domain-containing protein [Bryobacteraceae bacterium]